MNPADVFSPVRAGCTVDGEADSVIQAANSISLWFCTFWDARYLNWMRQRQSPVF
jgi:hypothetical protein